MQERFKTYHSGNTKGGSIAVLLTSCLTSLDKPVLQIKTKIVSCHTTDSKPVKQEVNGTVILPPFSIPCTIREEFPKGLYSGRLKSLSRARGKGMTEPNCLAYYVM